MTRRFFAGRTSGFSQDGLQIEHAARAGTGRLQEKAGYRFVRRKYMAHLLGRELGWPGMNGGKCNANASSSHWYVKLRGVFATKLALRIKVSGGNRHATARP